MDIRETQEKFEDLMLCNPDFDESLLEKDDEGCYADSDINAMYSTFEAGTEIGERQAWQAAKASVAEGFVLVSHKDLLDLTVAINAVDLATHTDSKTNEVREIWQTIAIKLSSLGEAQEQK